MTIHAVEAEQALLGGMLVNNDGYAMVMDRLLPEHFFEPVHARIYEAIAALIREAKIASPVTMATFFRDDPALAEIGGPVYLAHLAAGAVTVLNCREYSEIIIDAWVRRQSLMVLDGLNQSLLDAGGGAEKVRNALAQISEISDPPRGARVTLAQSTEAVFARINDYFQTGKQVTPSVSTGSHDLDKIIGGLARGELYIIGARPSMGKTTIALSLLTRAAMRGAGVLYFSLEMKAGKLASRVLADLYWRHDRRLHYSRINRGDITEAEFRELIDMQEFFKTIPLIIDERPGLNMQQIRGAAIREKRRLEAVGKRLDVIAIDHLGLAKASNTYRGDKVSETEELSGESKALAKDLDCAVVDLVQLNRGVETRDDKRPTLADLRWSGSIEQDADVVAFIYREAYYLERKAKAGDGAAEAELIELRSKMEVLVAKNRDGGSTKLEMFCDMPCGVVRDMDQRVSAGPVPDFFE